MTSEPDEPGTEQTLGDELFGDRNRVATTEGVMTLDQVVVKEIVNGHGEKVLDSFWRAGCPVCYSEHESDGSSEEERMDAWEAGLDCCKAEWLPPSDWVEDCGICGGEHRGKFGCSPPTHRDPFPGVDNQFRCGECGWSGHGEGLNGPTGTCPECESEAVGVVADA